MLMTLPLLSPLSSQQQTQTKALSDYLRTSIAAHGPMRFAEFMAACLYHPNFGYYTGPTHPFGPSGDFITSPELTPAFGQTLAHSVAGILANLNQGEIVEVGAGSGALAASLLPELAKHNTLPRYYTLVEISPTLRQRQAETFSQLAPDVRSRIRWLDAIPTTLEGVILANELLDAFPIDLYHWQQKTLVALGVTWDGDNFVWTSMPDISPPQEMLTLAQTLPDNYWLEYHREAITWLTTTAMALKKGVILCFDYGYEAREYYHPSRNRGTLRSFRQHLVSDNPLGYPGLQDLTCHVNFTALQKTAIANGLQVSGFTNQANFLLAAGLRFPDDLSIEAQYTMAQAFKTLLLPSEMGELIKVLALTRDYCYPILGFNQPP